MPDVRHDEQELSNPAGFREALTATAEDLLSMNVIPVFNENDAILSAMPLLVGIIRATYASSTMQWYQPCLSLPKTSLCPRAPPQLIKRKVSSKC